MPDTRAALLEGQRTLSDVIAKESRIRRECYKRAKASSAIIRKCLKAKTRLKTTVSIKRAIKKAKTDSDLPFSTLRIFSN